uniref:VWFA domain-containing protein n=1 Tax=Globodera pallida TaxID=36090 RepID=A0A183C171_GLOPA
MLKRGDNRPPFVFFGSIDDGLFFCCGFEKTNKCSSYFLHLSSTTPQFYTENSEYAFHWFWTASTGVNSVIEMDAAETFIGTGHFPHRRAGLPPLRTCSSIYEFEYLNITRDTTEADIKQRREIKAGSAFYTDLGAVRAALRGRILFIDGVEKAERNVLPILNNLLENREMQLDDGRFLMAADKFDRLLQASGSGSKPPKIQRFQRYSLQQLKEWKLERVSEHFRVIALGLPVPPFYGHSLDPPLRSRFQCHNLGQLPFVQMLQMCSLLAPSVPKLRLERLLSLAYGLNAAQERKGDGEEAEGLALDLPQFPTDNLLKATNIWNICPDLGEELILQLCYPNQILQANSRVSVMQQFKQKFGVEHSPRMDLKVLGVTSTSNDSQQERDGGREVTARISADGKQMSPFGLPPSRRFFGHDKRWAGVYFCLLGVRGGGKSLLVNEFAKKLGYSVEMETIVLYQDMSSRELFQRRKMLPNGDTQWEDNQLVRAAKSGTLCVLDGIDRVHWSTAEALASLVHHRFLALPDGARLVGNTNFALLKRRSGLTEQMLNERKVFRIPESFRIIALGDSESAPKWLNAQLLSQFIFCSLPDLSIDDRLRIIQQRVQNVSVAHAKRLLRLTDRLSHSHDAAIRTIASSLSLRRLLHILRRNSAYPDEGIFEAIHRAALTRFVPPVVRQAFEATLAEIGIVPDAKKKHSFKHDELEKMREKMKPSKGMPSIGENGGKVGVRSVDEAMVPSTLFFDNPQHIHVMVNMARDFHLGAHLLLIGNQGVGKNKVTDRLLEILDRPRKYIQLHRDTTVQSLTVQSTVVDGILRYEDSALVQALSNGFVLVIDEADKAPLHVVAILKSLLDEEPFYLSDGRRVCPAHLKKNNNGSKNTDVNDIYVHPQFRAILLANRPGFPFLGNDLYALLGDLLAVHALDNPSHESEMAMLSKYGPDVPQEVLELLVSVFGDLRLLVDQQLISYPYSTRELVNIVKHLQKYPDDPLPQVIRNVFDFDAYSVDTGQLISEAFQRKGISIAVGSSSIIGTVRSLICQSLINRYLARSTRIMCPMSAEILGRVALVEHKKIRFHFGTTPRDLEELVVHSVHQLPDSAKEQVPDHIRKKAREIAGQEYAKRLKEIDMGEHDAAAYQELATRVGRQVRVLRSVIDSLEQRKHERQWAKHQTSGDLDDAKLIEGMAGERNIYRKRVEQPPDPSSQKSPKRIRLCFDVSGSMYRFNGYDQRLQRSLEAALLVMEGLDGKGDKVKYDIYGHSGESASIPFVTLDQQPTNEKERLNVLKRMLAHSQFCSSGDYTVEALSLAVRELDSEGGKGFDEQFVVLLSDANLDRYGIHPSELGRALQIGDSVNAFVVLIGSLGQQAAKDISRQAKPLSPWTVLKFQRLCNKFSLLLLLNN